MHPFLTTVLGLTAVAAAAPTSPTARLSPPPGCLTVGWAGTYKTVQSAINALSPTTTSEQCIFLYRGTYVEQISINLLSSPLTLYGETPDTSTSAQNTATITQNESQTHKPHNDETATLRAHTPNLKLYNINIWNTRGRGAQALAVSAQADRQGYYACAFTGYQDTIMAQQGTQVYAASRVEGATDFIFGLRGRAWFDGLDIRVVGAEKGYVTANGRDSEENASFYVINNSTIRAVDYQDVEPGAYFLGRPWRDHARVVFQFTGMSEVVSPAGWSAWSDSEPRTEGVLFGEFASEGAGAKGERAAFAEKLDAAVSIEEVLGEDYKSWVDTSYLS